MHLAVQADMATCHASIYYQSARSQDTVAGSQYSLIEEHADGTIVQTSTLLSLLD
jgi:hypothetical protein